MNRLPIRPFAAAAAAAALTLAASACGSSEAAPEGAKKLAYELTDEGCKPHTAKAPAGPIAFEFENTGSSKVTEIEVMEGDSILGEEENVTEGLDGSFTLTLEQGEYTVYCPGGSHERGTLTVTGAEHLSGASEPVEKKDDD